jgi:DMSO/TMAO reductase YedYZ molybdopterin-dependent catalytic subunit
VVFSDLIGYKTLLISLLHNCTVILNQKPHKEGTEMDDIMRVMTPRPRNAETPRSYLRSWITANKVFFDRNQGEIPQEEIDLSTWNLTITGMVENTITIDFDQLLAMPKAIVANTLECSGNSRSLLSEKASGNPWTIGGVGNAVWGGVWLKDLLALAGVAAGANHVAFAGYEKSLGRSQIKFIRSIPIDKAMSSTLLAYEMNGEPLPVKHGFPLRALALGWTGANCVKWLEEITVMEKPYEGFFMDKVYRIHQPGEDPATGEYVKGIQIKAIITQPEPEQVLKPGNITILGAAYGGEKDVATVEVSTDGGASWQGAEFIGPHEPFAWRQWQYVWSVTQPGRYTILARATTTDGETQPMQASWNKLGYNNNGVEEHGIPVEIVP